MRLEVQRTTGREQMVCGTEIGLPGGADFAVGPGKAGDPFNRIVSIRHFSDECVICLPFGRKTPARVLHDHPITALDKVVDVPGDAAAGSCCTAGATAGQGAGGKSCA